MSEEAAQNAQGPEPTTDDLVTIAFIQAISTMFPALGLLKQAMSEARKYNKIVTVPLIFSPDGRILVSQPIVKQMAPVPPAEGSVVLDTAPSAEVIEGAA